LEEMIRDYGRHLELHLGEIVEIYNNSKNHEHDKFN
jgi:hypothetical protein